jgi:hypothetical protein
MLMGRGPKSARPWAHDALLLKKQRKTFSFEAKTRDRLVPIQKGNVSEVQK